MKVEIESTAKLVTINGIEARVWQGKTASGIPVTLLVPWIAVDKGAPAEEFERELQEHAPPTAWPLRMIL